MSWPRAMPSLEEFFAEERQAYYGSPIRRIQWEADRRAAEEARAMVLGRLEQLPAYRIFARRGARRKLIEFEALIALRKSQLRRGE